MNLFEAHFRVDPSFEMRLVGALDCVEAILEG